MKKKRAGVSVGHNTHGTHARTKKAVCGAVPLVQELRRCVELVVVDVNHHHLLHGVRHLFQLRDRAAQHAWPTEKYKSLVLVLCACVRARARVELMGVPIT